MKKGTIKIKTVKKEKIKIFRDLLLARPLKFMNDKTDGGIWIPNSVENTVEYFEVLEVGREVKGVKAGDRILTTKHMGQEFHFNGEDLIVMRERNAAAVVDI